MNRVTKRMTELLDVLDEFGPLTGQQVVRELNEAYHSGVHKSLHRLESLGFISRNEEMRHYSLTDEGTSFLLIAKKRNKLQRVISALKKQHQKACQELNQINLKLKAFKLTGEDRE